MQKRQVGFKTALTLTIVLQVFQVNNPKVDSNAGFNADNLYSIFFFSNIFTAVVRRSELAAWLTIIFIILVIQVCVVNESLEVVYHTLVKPVNPITNYLTQYSGVTREMLQDVTTRYVAILDTVIGKIWSQISTVYLGLKASCAQLYSLAETPQPPPPHPPHRLRALLVSQDRRHLFVTPWIVLWIFLIWNFLDSLDLYLS